MRLTWDEYGCLLAMCASLRSRDPFTKVGACAMDSENRVLGCSYNGEVPGVSLSDSELKNREEKNKYFIHAETNILSLIKRGECDTLYLTISPCLNCCAGIAAHGIKRVVFVDFYWRDKDREFLKVLKRYKVEAFLLTQSSVRRILSEINFGVTQKLKGALKNE